MVTIEINRPELEAPIEELVKNGPFFTVEELLLDALKPGANPLASTSEQFGGRRNLVELFAESPFAGLVMDFERFSDTFPDLNAH